MIANIMTKCNDKLVREKIYLSKYEFCMSSLLIDNIMAKRVLVTTLRILCSRLGV
jgi:hypothetical protein